MPWQIYDQVVTSIASIVERLARVIRAEHIPVWMTTPLEALDGERPIDVMARGDDRRIARLISNLEEPGAI